jgi:hypothetical protein
MRVKLLLALAIASVLLFCSMVVAVSALSGVPTAAQLTNAADQQMCACGFPDLSSLDTTTAAVVPQDTIDATTLTSPICGVCGEIPACTCDSDTEVICGPEVNLGCPTISVFPVPVCLESPEIEAEFPCIDVAPQVCLGLPQVNADLTCFDIACLPVTSYNECPVCEFDDE